MRLFEEIGGNVIGKTENRKDRKRKKHFKSFRFAS
jgi:hypothetical protein